MVVRVKAIPKRKENILFKAARHASARLQKNTAAINNLCVYDNRAKGRYLSLLFTFRKERKIKKSILVLRVVEVRNTFPVLLYKENSLKSPKESINK
jgi:hypothetical protein